MFHKLRTPSGNDIGSSYELSDAQWEKIEPMILKRLSGIRKDDRLIISGIIYMGLSGYRWADCPRYYGEHSTVHGRYRSWRHPKFWNEIIEMFEANRWAAEARAMHANSVLRNRPLQRGLRIDRRWRQSYQYRSCD
ncbi:transposase [Methylobacterium sp. 092160098-2]|uniref:transposase n=1 Tax=Methylobacterium sp. 092160098-2 TaxID=3025129 RepID=UPI00406D2CCE